LKSGLPENGYRGMVAKLYTLKTGAKKEEEILSPSFFNRLVLDEL
jgi:hypothetical protein